MTFSVSELPFVCRPHAPLIFRKRSVKWEEIRPPIRDSRSIRDLIGHPLTFTSPGPISCPAEMVAMSSAGLTFAIEGAFNLNTPAGAFKLLILPPTENSYEDALAIARFVAANVVHSGADVQSITYDPYVASTMYYPNAIYKLFYTDQPLQLYCGQASMVLCALLNDLGLSYRQVLLDGHVSVELKDKEHWFMADPDFDASVIDRESGYTLDCQAFLSLLSQDREDRLEIGQLTGKHWIYHQRPWGFYGAVSWTQQQSLARCCDGLVVALKGMSAVEYRQITRIEKGVISFG